MWELSGKLNLNGICIWTRVSTIMINKGKEVRTIGWVNVMKKYIENIIGNLALVYLL